MTYYKSRLIDKRTGNIIASQKGYCHDLDKAKMRFANQNLGKGLYAVVDIEQISDSEYKSLPRKW